jgi:hypothetical protein
MKILNRFGKPFTPHLIVPRAQKCRAYQFADGFDNYNSASLLYQTINGSPSYGTSYRRFAPPSGLPGQGVYLPSGAWMRRNLLSNQATLIPKIAYCPLSLPSGSMAILTCYDGNAGNAQVSIVVTNAGAIAAYRAWSTPYSTLLGTSNPSILQGNLYYGIECFFTISTTVGVVQVWVNGVEVLSLSGLNTQQSNPYATAVQICDGGNTGCYVDDFRIWDNTGSYENAALGTDSRIVTKLPNGAGATTQWTPNGASANWQCVDDNPPDGDSTYVSSSTVNNVDEYTAPSAGFTAAPKMVLARIYARKDDSATRSVEFGVVSSGSSLSGNNATMGSGYAFYDADCSAEDPHTLAAWTAAGADAAGFWKQETA